MSKRASDKEGVETWWSDGECADELESRRSGNERGGDGPVEPHHGTNNSREVKVFLCVFFFSRGCAGIAQKAYKKKLN